MIIFYWEILLTNSSTKSQLIFIIYSPLFECLFLVAQNPMFKNSSYSLRPWFVAEVSLYLHPSIPPPLPPSLPPSLPPPPLLLCTRLVVSEVQAMRVMIVASCTSLCLSLFPPPPLALANLTTSPA